MPSGPGPIEDRMIRLVASSVPPPIGTFLLTSETTPKAIIAHHKRTQTNTIQIVDELQVESYAVLRADLPNVKLVQVIHIMNQRSVEKAVAVSTYVEAILLDSGNPSLPGKELVEPGEPTIGS